MVVAAANFIGIACAAIETLDTRLSDLHRSQAAW